MLGRSPPSTVWHAYLAVEFALGGVLIPTLEANRAYGRH
jgi:hypothetical protein